METSRPDESPVQGEAWCRYGGLDRHAVQAESSLNGERRNKKSTDLRPRLKPVSDPGIRNDVAWRSFIDFQFLSQVSNANAQIFGLFHAVGAPNGRQQRAVSDDPVGVTREIDENLELFRGEMDFASPYFHSVTGDIDMEIANVDDRSFLLVVNGCPAESGAHPC